MKNELSEFANYWRYEQMNNLLEHAIRMRFPNIEGLNVDFGNNTLSFVSGATKEDMESLINEIKNYNPVDGLQLQSQIK